MATATAKEDKRQQQRSEPGERPGLTCTTTAALDLGMNNRAAIRRATIDLTATIFVGLTITIVIQFVAAGFFSFVIGPVDFRVTLPTGSAATGLHCAGTNTFLQRATGASQVLVGQSITVVVQTVTYLVGW